MSTGVKLANNCMEVFDEMKMRHQHALVFYKLNDNFTQIVVDKTFPTDTPFSTFLENLPENECRYALVDFAYNDDTLSKKSLVFFSWCPSRATIRNKMIYTASKDALKKALVGVKSLQGCDLSEVQEDKFIEKVLKV